MLALALGKSVQEVGSLSYREQDTGTDVSITKNNRFTRLIDVATPGQQGELGILNTRPASEFTEEEISSPPPFNELNGLPDFKFEGTFATQTGSGCLYGCDFCPSKKFFGAGYEAHLGVAKEEILNFKKKFPNLQEVFLTFTDAMVNSDENHLRVIIDLMTKVNMEDGPRISWFCYLSAPHRSANATPEQVEEWKSKWDSLLSDMAKAGCIMGAVGVEEVIYDRNKIHHKGQDVDTASEFVDMVGKHMLARTLLIMGAPEHFYLDRSKTLKDSEYLDSKYSSDRDLIKGEILDFMKKHPQALFRINPWTLVYGTDNYYKYEDCMSVDMSDPKNLKLLDQLHSTIDPEKMYSHLEKESGVKIPEEKRWVKNQQVWFELMGEIMFEYLQSPEYLACLELLKDKDTAGKKGLLYKISIKFQKNVLEQIQKNKTGRKS